MTQNGPAADLGYIGWEITVFNSDSTDHVIHTRALCGPGGLSVTNQAKRVRPAVVDQTRPISRH